MKQHERDFAAQTPKGDFWNRSVNRRGFLQRAGRVGAILGAGALGDTIQGELLWGGTSPEVHRLYNPDTEKKFPDTYTLAIGGFNVANTEGLGRDIEALLGEFGQVAYLKNSNDGIDMRDIEREVLRFIEGWAMERLYIYGHSMGGMVAVDLANRIKDKVGSLEAVILDCTPASELDVRRQGQIGTWVLQQFDELSLHFGPNARAVAEAVGPIVNGNDPIKACLEAMNKVSANMCSNKLVQSQASFIRAFNVEDYKNSFSAGTRIIRLRPYDYMADPTINNRTSFPRWCEGLNHDVIDVPVRGGGHANPGSCKEQYGIAMRNAAKRLGFYDGSPIRSSARPI